MKVFDRRRSQPDIDQWAKEHYQAVWAFCRRRVGMDLASDLTQDTFVTAEQKRSSYREDVPPRAWLFGIALNHCRNRARNLGREVQIDWLADTPAPEGADMIECEALRQALAKLSEDHRAVVILKEVEGLTYDEIGKVLDVPSGTVKSRLHHAFVQLRKELCTGSVEA